MNKNILLPVLVGVVALACLLAVNANLSALKKNLDIERYKRLDKERELDIALKNSRRIQDELSEAKHKLEGIQNIVSEGQSTTTQLKTEVESTAKENENLKQSIKKLQDDLTASQKAVQAAQQAVTAVPVAPATPPPVGK